MSLARAALSAAAVVPAASLVGLLSFGGITVFVYSTIALANAVTRYRLERATRIGQVRAAEQAQASRGTLAAQLRQIEEARAAGLIQEGEYQVKRAEIIARV